MTELSPEERENRRLAMARYRDENPRVREREAQRKRKKMEELRKDPVKWAEYQAKRRVWYERSRRRAGQLTKEQYEWTRQHSKWEKECEKLRARAKKNGTPIEEIEFPFEPPMPLSMATMERPEMRKPLPKPGPKAGHKAETELDAEMAEWKSVGIWCHVCNVKMITDGAYIWCDRCGREVVGMTA